VEGALFALAARCPGLAGKGPAEGEGSWATRPAGGRPHPRQVAAVMNKPKLLGGELEPAGVTDLSADRTADGSHPDQLAFTGSVRKAVLGGRALQDPGAGARVETRCSGGAPWAQGGGGDLVPLGRW